MSTTIQTFEALPEFIRSAIDSEIKRITDEELDAAKNRIDERKSQVIAGVLLHVQRAVEVQTMNNHLIISIDLRNN